MAAQELDAMGKELKDREMIKELVHQHVHCIRQNDIDSLGALFVEEGTIAMDPTIFAVVHLSRVQAHPVHGTMTVTPTVFTGRVGLRRFYTETLPQLGTPYHLLHNFLSRKGC